MFGLACFGCEVLGAMVLIMTVPLENRINKSL